MATGVKRKPTKGGLYQAYFTDYSGKKRYFTALTRSDGQVTCPPELFPVL